MRVNCYFGYTGEMKTYRVGDTYDWVPRKAIQNGGYPSDGHLQGEGYAECPKCGKDSFVIVHIVEGRICQALTDLSRLPYDPDKALYDLWLTCPSCQRVSVSEVHLYHGYNFGRVSCDCGCIREVYVDLEQTYLPQVEVSISPQSRVFVFETNVVRNR